MNSQLIAKILLGLVIVPYAFAQQKGGGEKGPLFSINPNARNTEVILRPANEDDQEAEAGDDDSPGPAVSLTASQKRWSRHTVGLWFSMANAAMLKAHFRVTSDEVLKGNATEFGFGGGGMLDMPLPGGSMAQALRFTLGIQKMSIHPKDELLDTYASTQLEKSATVFSLAGFYRAAPELDLDFGTLWFGGGLILNNAFATKWQGGSESDQGVTKLRGSYAFIFAACLGMDFPISDVSDAEVGVDWYPLSGFSLKAGLRTTL